MTLSPVPANVLLLHNHDNTWTEADLIEVAEENRKVMEALRRNGYHVEDAKVYSSVTQALKGRDYDPREWLVFNWCEGYADRPWDYDGVVEELERLNFTYTGSGVWPLRISRDKWRVRQILMNAGVPVPNAVLARSLDDTPWTHFPAIVKPINQHSSYGIDRASVVLDRERLRARLEYVFDEFHAPALIEEFIMGREFQVTVWGNNPPTVLPAGELDYSDYEDPYDHVYTYEDKFDYDSPNAFRIRWLCPTMMEVQARRQLKFACLQAYRALRCRDYTRVDLRLRDNQPYVVDVNPNPDINSESMVVTSSEAAGLSYDDMIVQIVRFASERWKRARRPLLPAHTTALTPHRRHTGPLSEPASLALRRDSDRNAKPTF